MRPPWIGLAKVVVGLGLGLVLAELLFAYRDDGAFAHVNFYEPDAQLGVRLRPHARMRIAFGGNPASEIATNARGFRGREWPEPQPQDLLLLGDSQVFGLGVGDQATVGAQLERAFAGKVHVLNAGVPTYGPREYEVLLERLLPERKPDHVVVVLNLANDLFELERSNRQRHAVWDGWAVRKETAPASTRPFPFRHWFMSQSHLVHALRRLLHDVDTQPDLPSEGGYQALVASAAKGERGQPAGDEPLHAATERNELSRKLTALEGTIARLFIAGVRSDARYRKAVRGLGYAGDPRDILSNEHAEEARPINETAFQLVYASLALADNDQLLRALAERTPRGELLHALDERRALRARLALQSDTLEAAGRSPSALEDYLLRVARLCDRASARLTVVALPLDVQVSSTEWKKYGESPIDLTPTHALGRDLVLRAQAVGARGLDATATLAAAEPGAFLLRDLHMSAKGHAALARFLHAELTSGSNVTDARPPLGRSLLPARDEWLAVRTQPAPELEARGCELKQVREWLRLICRREQRTAPPALVLLAGGHGDAFVEVEPYDSTRLVFPLLEGEVLHARLSWPDLTSELSVSLDADGKARSALSADAKGEKGKGVEPVSLLAESDVGGGYIDARCVRRVGFQHAASCMLGSASAERARRPAHRTW